MNQRITVISEVKKAARQIPVLDIGFRLLDLVYAAVLFGTGLIMVFRAGETALARGVWMLPEIPEFLIVVAGLLVVNVSIHSVIRAVLPRRWMQ